MVPPTRHQAAIGFVLLLVLLGAVGMRMGGIDLPVEGAAAPGGTPRSAPAESFRAVPRSGGGGRVLVDVAGAVRAPGVYALRDGDRVLDAIEQAGGPLPAANLTAVNRAAPVVDGQQVVVPAVVAVERGAPAAGGTAAGARLVSLNSGDEQAFDALPGIGPVTARKIVDDRAQNGPFRSVDDLQRVPGVGPATIEALRDAVTL